MSVYRKRFIVFSCFICWFVCFGDVAMLFHYSKGFPGYSHMSELISELGSTNSPVSPLFSAWWIIAGIFLIIFAIGLYYTFSSEGRAAVNATWLLIFYAIGDCVVSGLFKDDHFHGGDLTTASKIHVVLGAIGIFALLVFPLAMQKIFTMEKNYRFYYFSRVIFYIGLVTTALLFFRYYTVAYLTDLQGLWQRITLVNFYTYFTVIAAMMFKKTENEDELQDVRTSFEVSKNISPEKE